MNAQTLTFATHLLETLVFIFMGWGRDIKLILQYGYDYMEH